jgi:hypothetical protein
MTKVSLKLGIGTFEKSNQIYSINMSSAQEREKSGDYLDARVLSGHLR